MWSDLSRLVDGECKNGLSFYSKHFLIRLEVDSDVNIPQAGLCEVRLYV